MNMSSLLSGRKLWFYIFTGQFKFSLKQAIVHSRRNYCMPSYRTCTRINLLPYRETSVENVVVHTNCLLHFSMLLYFQYAFYLVWCFIV